jgi:hypothetical protein
VNDQSIPNQRVYQGLAQQNADVLAGFEFIATLQLRTPLFVLNHDREKREITEDLPAYGPPWAGIWVPRVRTWAELGFTQFRESPDGDRASTIGPVPADGGALLPFLKEYRLIVESAMSVEDRVDLIRGLVRRPEHADVVARLGGELPTEWAVAELAETLGIGLGLAQRMFDAGYLDAARVRAASDDQLRTIRGVGPARLRAIRRGQVNPT